MAEFLNLSMVFNHFLIVLIFLCPSTNFWVISSNTYFTLQILFYLFNLFYLLLNISTEFLTYSNSIITIPYSLLIFSGVSIIFLNILNLFFYSVSDYFSIWSLCRSNSVDCHTWCLVCWYVLWFVTVSSRSQYFICGNYLKLELQLATPEKICACFFFFFVSCLGGITTCNYF